TGLRHPGAVAVEKDELPDRQVHRLLVNELLDPMHDRLALPDVELGALLPEQDVDIGISAVGVDATGRHERLEPGVGVAEDAAEAVDDVLQLLLLIRLEERRTLERSQPGADADRLQVVDERLRVPGGRGVAPELAGVEAARIPGLGQEPAGAG